MTNLIDKRLLVINAGTGSATLGWYGAVIGALIKLLPNQD